MKHIVLQLAAIVICCAFLLSGFGVLAADSVQKLINQEKEIYEEWLNELDDPPEAYLWGREDAVQIYSPSVESSGQSVLCSEINMPELVELSGGNINDYQSIVNLSVPRVRQMIGDACLVRPGDDFVAIGQGWQTHRTVKDFIVEHEKPNCPSNPPYGLWMTFEDPLPDRPFFLLSGLNSQIEDNQFTPIDHYSKSEGDVDLLQRLNQVVQFLEDYRVSVYEIGTADIDALLVLERVHLSDQDDRLPSSILMVLLNNQLTQIWLERVDAAMGTGRFDVLGTMDFDGDGFLEIAIRGVHEKCPYLMVFQRSDEGYVPLPLPRKLCRC